MNTNSNIKTTDLIVIGGPTASGKTDLAINVAKLLDGEIVNSDSVQVYKYMDIGSNKGSIEAIGNLQINNNQIVEFEIENSGINGVLFDLVEPSNDFNVSIYKSYADSAIDYLNSKNKIPILTGGTGLYIDAVIKGYNFKEVEANNSYRNELSKLSLSELTDKLKTISENIYMDLNNSDKNNPRRLIRLLEKAKNNLNIVENKNKYNNVFLYPEFDKDVLMDKIDTRVDWMFNNGFVEEVEKLIKNGYSLKNIAMQSAGYKQIFLMLNDNKYTLEECIEEVKNSHRKLAKRQITWFEGEGRKYNLIRVNSSNLNIKLKKAGLII
ncbi:tRNA (adenosine(37)-N6)-dimethylallyltransferase MiaA [Candidatus Dojkabacteria bacterium]|nr:tRNA (adenosine(37)-N6)-dimethylallyltransferase MiaA [Candidatus Dojkabacteria bacterium]